MTPKKRKAADAFKKIRKGWAKSKATRPEKVPAYLDFLRQQCWCVVCERVTGSEDGSPAPQRTEAAHVGAVRGLRQKCSDWQAIPLCARHHRTGKNSHHVIGKHFWKVHGLNREALVKEFNERFKAL